MLDTQTLATKTETSDEAERAEYVEHPGADTLNVPTFDDAGFLRWGHAESEDDGVAS